MHTSTLPAGLPLTWVSHVGSAMEVGRRRSGCEANAGGGSDDLDGGEVDNGCGGGADLVVEPTSVVTSQRDHGDDRGWRARGRSDPVVDVAVAVVHTGGDDDGWRGIMRLWNRPRTWR